MPLLTDVREELIQQAATEQITLESQNAINVSERQLLGVLTK